MLVIDLEDFCKQLATLPSKRLMVIVLKVIFTAFVSNRFTSLFEGCDNASPQTRQFCRVQTESISKIHSLHDCGVAKTSPIGFQSRTIVSEEAAILYLPTGSFDQSRNFVETSLDALSRCWLARALGRRCRKIR